MAIVGSRTYPLPKELYDVLDDERKLEVEAEGRKHVETFMGNLMGGKQLIIVSGGAKGPDTWAIEFAAEKFTTIEIKPNWKKYGNGAAFKRNKEIVEYADDVVAFWDLVSNGTFHTLKVAAEYERPMMIFGPDGQLFFWATEDDYRKKKLDPDEIKKGNVKYS